MSANNKSITETKDLVLNDKVINDFVREAYNTLSLDVNQKTTKAQNKRLNELLYCMCFGALVGSGVPVL